MNISNSVMLKVIEASPIPRTMSWAIDARVITGTLRSGMMFRSPEIAGRWRVVDIAHLIPDTNIQRDQSIVMLRIDPLDEGDQGLLRKGVQLIETTEQ